MSQPEIKNIIVACPAGINTSTIGVAALEDLIRERKLGRYVKLIKSNLASLDRWAQQASIIIEMTPLKRTFGVPVVNGVPFISGTKAEKRALAESILKQIGY